MPRTLTIAEQKFEVGDDPYTAGHQITEAEAKVLNQTRAENMGNNLRAAVKAAIEKGEDALALVTDYASKYTFAMGGSSRTPVDPLERECLKVAREAVRDALAEQGKKLKEIDPERLAAYIEQVSGQDDVVAEAKKRIKAKSKKVAINLEGMGLSA